jgi:polysaccharide biosynthesis protein PslH
MGARHEVTLLSLAFGTAQPETGRKELGGICSAVRVVHLSPFERGWSAQALRFVSPIPIVDRELRPMRALVEQALAHENYEAVITSTIGMAEYVKLAPPGTVRVLEEHNSLSRQMWERYQRQVQPLQRLRCWASWEKTRRYEAAVMRRHDLAVMVSEQDREASLRMLPGFAGPVAVVPNGVDCVRNRPGMVDAEPAALVFNGALTYSANYDAMQHFLAEIYPLIKCNVPAANLTITGSLQHVDLAGLALDQSVHLTGYVEDVRSEVARSSICVAPIRQGGGTRLKILEAMALGVPVVATRKGAEGLEVVDREHILLADSPSAFAARVTELLADPALQSRLRANARRLVETRYDWRHLGATFTGLVEDLVSARRLQGTDP